MTLATPQPNRSARTTAATRATQVASAVAWAVMISLLLVTTALVMSNALHDVSHTRTAPASDQSWFGGPAAVA